MSLAQFRARFQRWRTDRTPESSTFEQLEVVPPAELRAALALAKKRRFGPFGNELPDRTVREKQLAAMLRAGHPLDLARALLAAASVEDAEDWAGNQTGDD